MKRLTVLAHSAGARAAGGAGARSHDIVKPLGTTDDWPTYSGDYSGKRYSALTQVNQSTVKDLTLAWNSG